MLKDDIFNNSKVNKTMCLNNYTSSNWVLTLLTINKTINAYNRLFNETENVIDD